MITDWVSKRRYVPRDVSRLKVLLVFFFDGKKVLIRFRLRLSNYTLSDLFKGIKSRIFCGMIKIFIPLPSKKIVGDDCA